MRRSFCSSQEILRIHKNRTEKILKLAEGTVSILKTGKFIFVFGVLIRLHVTLTWFTNLFSK